MLIFATIAINVAAVAVWSAIYGANGFKEVGKLIRGEAAFIPPEGEPEPEKDIDPLTGGERQDRLFPGLYPPKDPEVPVA